MKKIRLWLCKHFGWHRITQKWYSEEFFELLTYGKCEYCEWEGIIDSHEKAF